MRGLAVEDGERRAECRSEGLLLMNRVILRQKTDQLPDHILIRPEGRFTASTDLSVGEKQLITTINVHTKNPQVSS